MKRLLLIVGMMALAAPSDARRRTAVSVTQQAEDLAKEIKNKKDRPEKVFHLYVNDGEWEFADGKKTYIVSYVAFNDKFQEMPAGGSCRRRRFRRPPCA